MNIDGRKLRSEIARQQLTVIDFAKKAGLSGVAVYKALGGSRANTKTLGKMAAALGVENPCDLCLPQPAMQS